MKRALQSLVAAARPAAVAAARAAAEAARRQPVQRFLLPAGIVAAGLAVFLALTGGDDTAPVDGLTERAWSVEVTTARPELRTPTLELFGRLESPRLARLSAEIQAEVAEVHVREGDLVEAGAVVVVLDSRNAGLALRQSEAEVRNIRAQLALELERNREDRALLDRERRLLDLARNELARAEDLETRDLISRSEHDEIRHRAAQQELSLVARESAVRGHYSRRSQIEAQLAAAEAARDRAALDVARARSVSPFRGRVVEVLVAQGEQVGPGEPLVTMFDVSRVEVRAQIPSRHLAVVNASRGQRGYFDLGPRRYAVTLDRLGGQMQAGRGGVDALFTVDGAGDDLRIGRTVDLTLQLAAQPDAVWLPFEALYGPDRVFRVLDGRLVGVTVRRIGEARGPDDRAGVLVTSPGLAFGDRILVNQLANAVEGLRVEAVPAAEEAGNRTEGRQGWAEGR